MQAVGHLLSGFAIGAATSGQHEAVAVSKPITIQIRPHVADDLDTSTPGSPMTSMDLASPSPLPEGPAISPDAAAGNKGEEGQAGERKWVAFFYHLSGRHLVVLGQKAGTATWRTLQHSVPGGC